MRKHESSSDTETRADNITSQEEISPREGQTDTSVSGPASPADKVVEDKQASVQQMLTGTAKPENTGLQVYADKDGLPVMYDAAVQKQNKPARSEDISVLWHELLSPLTVIKGYISTLLELSHAITEEQKEQYLHGIESASNRVIRLLENLRDITRLEETDTLSPQHVSLPDLLRLIVSELHSQTTKHVIKIRPSSRLPMVKADPERIEQVLSNLLVNAIKYSPQGGDIHIETRMVRNEQDLKRMFVDSPLVKLPCLIVSVSDTGIGLPDTETDQIFDRFFRVPNKLTHTTPGAGLGLYICKIIVEAHGGNIWAKNRIQGGSTFSFSLPLEDSNLK